MTRSPHEPPPSPAPDDERAVGLDWETRWARLGVRTGLAAHEPVLVALSGGADSVLLLHLVARARPRPRVLAVHVDHGLRGAESEADAAFCARACAALGVPFARRRAALERDGANLEARARDARYALLAEEARRGGFRVVATGHHADDALETLVLRWLRGTELAGLAGLKPRAPLPCAGEGDALEVVRPLIDMRRAEVRAVLAAEGIAWREDSSNADPRFTRNRVRARLLPLVARHGGAGAIDNLRAFARAVERLEGELAARTAPLAWRPPAHAAARRGAADAHLGGTLERSGLAALSRPLARRALWRLLVEGTGRAPTRRALSRVLDDLAAGRCRRHQLTGGWVLQLRSDLLHLSPPPARLPAPTIERGAARQTSFVDDPRAADAPAVLRVGARASVRLSDGRRISAERVEAPAGSPVPRSAVEVELDAARLPGELTIRWPRPGDRFHALGAPGSRPLRRFLADAGIPREERDRVPLVFAGDELVWVAGLRPDERHKVRPRTAQRLRLVLHDAAPEPAPPAPEPEPAGLFT